jgi:hypothetical protein
MGVTNLDELRLTSAKVMGKTLSVANAVNGDEQQVKSANGAIAIPTAQCCTVHITKATAAALTLADPINITDDGKEMLIISDTAAAHTVSNAAGSGFNGGGAGSDVGTFAVAIGNRLRVVAYGGKWYVSQNVNVALA